MKSLDKIKLLIKIYGAINDLSERSVKTGRSIIRVEFNQYGYWESVTTNHHGVVETFSKT